MYLCWAVGTLVRSWSCKANKVWVHCNTQHQTLYLHVLWSVSDLTFRKGTRYGCGEEFSSRYNLLVKSSGSIFASCCAMNTKNRSEQSKDDRLTAVCLVRSQWHWPFAITIEWVHMNVCATFEEIPSGCSGDAVFPRTKRTHGQPKNITFHLCLL